jgi:hypothetical protein
VGGLLFLLAPYRIAHSYGHLNLVSTQTIPLFFWALDSTLQRPAPGEHRLWMLGGATLLVGAMSQYYLVMCLIAGAAYTVFMLLMRPRAILFPGWRLGVSVGFGALLAALPYISSLSCGVRESYGVARTRLWSADPVNFILPAASHPLWGEAVASLRFEPYEAEKTLYLGAVGLALALVGLVAGSRSLLKRRLVWFGVALVGFVFALGTDLWINNEPLQPDAPFWLPAYYLAQLPLLGSMRVWARFGVITMLFVALLAGLGTTCLIGRLRVAYWQRIVLVGVVLLVMLDFLPGNRGVSEVGPRPIDAWLAEQPGDFAVAFLPPENDLVNYEAMLGSLYHGKHLPAFIHSRHMPSSYHRYMLAALEIPDEESLRVLRALDLRYLIFDTSRYTGWRVPAWDELATQIEESNELRIITEINEYVVVEFKEPRAVSHEQPFRSSQHSGFFVMCSY